MYAVTMKEPTQMRPVFLKKYVYRHETSGQNTRMGM
jgi:hypothetical protein